MGEITTLGIDIAKNVFQLHGIDKNGKVILQKKVSRSKLPETIANLPHCLIGMEACGSSNYWALKGSVAFSGNDHEKSSFPKF